MDVYDITKKHIIYTNNDAFVTLFNNIYYEDIS